MNLSVRNAPSGLPSAALASDLYADPPGLLQPLRVTLVVPDRIPKWLSVFIELASENHWIALTVLPVIGTVAPLQPTPSLSLDLRAFLAFEHARRRPAGASLSAMAVPAPAGVTVAAEIAANAKTWQIQARVAELQPDVVLLLAPADWAGAIAHCANWGCWHLDESLTDPERAGLALLAPILRAEFATSLELELQGPTRAPVTLTSSWGATCASSFLVHRERAFRKLPVLLVRALHRLAASELHLTLRCPATLRQAQAGGPLGFAPGVRALAKTLTRSARLQINQRRRSKPWLLLVRQGSTLLDPVAPEVGASAVLQAPAGSFWADPCAVHAPGRKLLFVEEMAPGSNKGTIVCIELQHDRARRLGVALEAPVHLSYPQVFEWDGQWYLTAEASQSERVTLYRASEFPLQWTPVQDLISGRVCVDPTLHFHEGHWYLFATVSENGNSTWDELFLFVADDLTGPFRPHPGNPILSDVRRARPAGRLFIQDGKLIRPSQDCAPGYGSAVVFNQVLELSPTCYREQPLSRLAPAWTVACHTYSRCGDMEVLDARGDPSAQMPHLLLTGPDDHGRALDSPAQDSMVVARIEQSLAKHAGPAQVGSADA